MKKLSTFDKSYQLYNRDFSKVVKPTVNTIDYNNIILILEQNQYSRTSVINYEDYREILGEYYDEEYFQQLFELYQYSEILIQSDLFNEDSTIEERQQYLEEVLIHVILNGIEDNTGNRNSNCSAYYTSCRNKAERNHGIRVGSCTAGAVVLAFFAAGAGAATWPICMATSGLLYDSAMTGCSDNYAICNGQ